MAFLSEPWQQGGSPPAPIATFVITKRHGCPNVYSAFASLKTGMSGSAPFHKVITDPSGKTHYIVSEFDRIRRKRNVALYDDTGFVSRHDAEQALESARRLIEAIRTDVNLRKP